MGLTKWQRLESIFKNNYRSFLTLHCMVRHLRHLLGNTFSTDKNQSQLRPEIKIFLGLLGGLTSYPIGLILFSTVQKEFEVGAPMKIKLYVHSQKCMYWKYFWKLDFCAKELSLPSSGKLPSTPLKVFK
jgi:hypothetical protein